MVSNLWYLGLLALVALERGFELFLSRRNAKRAFARGGLEVGQGHWRPMILVHASFLIACASEVLLWERAFVPLLGWPMLGLVLGAQSLRYWAIRTLGEAWNTRVIVVPGAPVVDGGPYRYLRHPNYAAVAIEIIALPLVHTAWVTALAYSLANAFLLRVRSRSEEAALRAHSNYDDRLADRDRLLPRRARAR